jgi:hypothetical protein
VFTAASAREAAAAAASAARTAEGVARDMEALLRGMLEHDDGGAAEAQKQAPSTPRTLMRMEL